MQQGKKANYTGETTENNIAAMLQNACKGWRIRRQTSLCKDIYGRTARVDFLVRGMPVHPEGIILEVKHQKSRGSIDEKFPYLVMSIKQCYPYPTIIILDGDGYSKGAERWLRRQIGGKLYGVMSFSEFQNWLFEQSDVSSVSSAPVLTLF